MHPNKYMSELVAERSSLDSAFVHAVRLLAEEIEKHDGDDVRKDGDIKKYLDIISNKNIKLSERVLIPAQQYPKFNFVGKLLGPRGNSMKRLQEETGVKMSILGKGSMRDKDKEEELRKSGEAKYTHLSDDLHVLIEVFAPPGEAYARMSHALEEIKKFLVPDYNDEIRQEQLRELSLLNGSDDSSRGRSVQGRSVRANAAASANRMSSRLRPRGSGTASRGHRSSGRSAAAPRGTASAASASAASASAASQHNKVPATVLTRDARVPKTRGAATTGGFRVPLLAGSHEAYDDYGYDDGYGGDEYDDESYDAYEENYNNMTKNHSEYYEYRRATRDESYDTYEEEWPSPRPSMKAPLLRLTRGGYRKHPYAPY